MPTIDSSGLTANIASRIDVPAAFRDDCGIRFEYEPPRPRSSGMISCYSIDRPDQRTPSAFINIHTATYSDSAATAGGRSISLWQLAADQGRHGGCWMAAREHYANLANVDLKQFGVLTMAERERIQKREGKRRKTRNGNRTAGGEGSASPSQASAVRITPGGRSSATARPSAPKTTLRPRVDRHEELRIMPWHAGNRSIARSWGATFKAPISLSAIMLCGGQPAWFKCRKDPKTGKVKDGEHRCIAMPCYAPPFTPKVGSTEPLGDPVSWQLWNMAANHHGGRIKVWRKGLDPEFRKITSVSGTYGTMMGAIALRALTHPAIRANPGSITTVFKTAGPADMLALVTAILTLPLEHPHRKSLVVCNASGEFGEVPEEVAEVFRGHRVALVGDCDDTGQGGIHKWTAALTGIAAEISHVPLPYAITRKSGKDARDFFAGVEDEAQLSN